MENCLVTVDSVISYRWGDHRVKFTVPGTFALKDGRYVVSYKERDRGLEGVMTELLAGREEITLSRPGREGFRPLELRPGKTCPWKYDTGSGGLDLSVRCVRAENTLGRNGGGIRMRYFLFSGGELLSKNTVKVTVKEIKQIGL